MTCWILRRWMCVVYFPQGLIFGEQLKDGGEMVIKPQFEAGREKVGKKLLCVTRLFTEVVERIIEFASQNRYFCKIWNIRPSR